MDLKATEETKVVVDARDVPKKVVVITGANGGIGRATAKLLAEVPGVKLVLVDQTEKVLQLGLFVNQLNVNAKFTAGHIYYVNDVADTQDVHDVAEAIISFCGRIDVLVHLAGIPPQKFGAFVRTPMEQVQAVINVNLLGTLNWCHAVLPHMRSQKFGRVINTSSVAGHRGDPGNSAYAVSKAGVESITKTLALEAPHNKDGEPLDITVNAVAPGGTDTPMIKTLPIGFFEEVKARVPFKRWGEPEEIANVIRYLALDAPQYLNGVVLSVDGGWSAS